MKKRVLKTFHSILIICIVFLLIAPKYDLFAQAQPIILNVQPAGTLSTLLGNKIDSIQDLTLTGSLNIEDVLKIREMKNLLFLKLSDANIVSSGSGYFSTKANEISSIFGLNLVNIVSIQLPNSLTTVGDNAFQGCTNLTSIRIPAKVTSIGHYAFSLCIGLKEFLVDNNNEVFTSTDGVLFNKQKSILILYPYSKSTTYSIPNTVNIIGEYSFNECTYLTSITIPNSVTTIGGSAFGHCIGLTSIIIPYGVTNIESDAFNRCTGLTSIVIPSSVTIISANAFGGCTSLTSIIIPNSITTLWNETFIGCWSLKEIHSQSSIPPSLMQYCFSDETIKSSTLYVPKGSPNDYRIADVWKDFTNIVEEDLTSSKEINNNDSYKIIGGIGIIKIETNEPMNITIFEISGKKVFDGLKNPRTQVNVKRGIYLVKTNDKSTKVLVN